MLSRCSFSWFYKIYNLHCKIHWLFCEFIVSHNITALFNNYAINLYPGQSSFLVWNVAFALQIRSGNFVAMKHSRIDVQFCSHEAKRSFFSPCAKGTLHRMKSCFVFHAHRALHFQNKKHFSRSAFCFGGITQTWTGGEDFADPCLTSWLWCHIVRRWCPDDCVERETV